MIKAIFFDIDGTLIDPKTDTVPASTLRTLQKLREKGIRLFVCTGRTPNMIHFLECYFPFDGFLSMNGQFCYDREKNVLHQLAMKKEALEALLTLHQQHRFPCLLIEAEDAFMVEEHQLIRAHFEMLPNDTGPVPYPTVYDPARLKNHDIFQFLVYETAKNGHHLKEIPHIEVTSASDFCFDVIPEGGGKQVGIAAIAAHYGFSREELMAFGDGDNDREMLRYVGTGVAMGNAQDCTKETADYITAPVWEDGIEKAVAHFGLV